MLTKTQKKRIYQLQRIRWEIVKERCKVYPNNEHLKVLEQLEKHYNI